MKDRFAIFCGKFVYYLGKKFTSCSSLPGKIALNIEKNLLKNIKKENNTIIFITGTNGKTSTTFYSYYTVKDLHNDVVTNLSGANMIQGVLTEILKKIEKKNFSNKLCVFEVDELTIPLLIKNGLIPNYVVITNLFDDQVDRYGSKEILAKTLRENLEKTDAKLIVNFEDPTLRIITDGIKNEVIYFGVQGEEKEVEKDNLIFKYLNYSSVGFFKAKDDEDFVDLKSYTLRECEDGKHCEVLSKEKTFKFEIKNREKFDIIYNRYNYVASFSLFMTLIRDGIVKCENPEEKISNAISLEVGNGRMENFKFLGKSTKLNLVKNKVGLELSLTEYAKETEKFDLVLALGNTPADGKDLNWIAEVDFKNFVENSLVDTIFITGNAFELVKEKLAKYLENNCLCKKFIFVSKDEFKEKLSKKTMFLAGFSELNDMRSFLENKNK
mgnify:CR=1 FL=1